jgi:hypothetical protein
MSLNKIASVPRRRTRRHLSIPVLILLLCLVMPATVLASDSQPASDEPPECLNCHPLEAEAWQASPHADALQLIGSSLQQACTQDMPPEDCECLSCHTTGFDPVEGTYAHAGVTCEACHGTYIEGHPQEGLMPLKVDSSQCEDCHAVTTAEWKETAHARANVQCISCHQAHSQEGRLTDESLCGSCHRDQVSDFSHTAHANHDVTCTSCHLAGPGGSVNGSDLQVNLSGANAAPSHSFQVVSQVCADCHGGEIHQMVAAGDSGTSTDVAMSAVNERLASVAMQLKDAERENRTLITMSVVSLGFGLGIGGVLGIVFVSVVCRLGQGRSET